MPTEKPFTGLKEAGEHIKGLHEEANHLHELYRGLEALAAHRVMVGIPASAKSRKEGKINNATLLFIHEHGSPAQGIPPRPSLNPGVRDSHREWGEHLKEAAKAAMEGNEKKMMQSFHKAGLVAATAVKKKIVAGIDPPLKPATIAARRRRHPSRKAASEADVTPLVDTAQMLNSITYAVEKNGRVVAKATKEPKE